MSERFSPKERKQELFQRHIKNHWLEYLLDFIGPVIFTIVLLYLCRAQEFIYGIVLSLAFSAGRLGYNLYHYRKEFLDIDISGNSGERENAASGENE